MNLFKILIPKDNAQEVTEVESYTVKQCTQGLTYSSEIVNHKSFINKVDAKEYEKQLKEAANFLKVWVSTKVYKN